eukprot:gene375-2381_t
MMATRKKPPPPPPPATAQQVCQCPSRLRRWQGNGRSGDSAAPQPPLRR